MVVDIKDFDSFFSEARDKYPYVAFTASTSIRIKQFLQNF